MVTRHLLLTPHISKLSKEDLKAAPHDDSFTVQTSPGSNMEALLAKTETLVL